MKITSTMKNIFSVHARGLRPQGYRHPASGGSMPQIPTSSSCTSHPLSHEIAPVRWPSPKPRRGPRNGIAQQLDHPQPWLIFLIASLLFCTNLPAQWTPDSLCKAYDRAVGEYKNGNIEAVDSLSPKITEAALQLGDTFVACSALNLHAAAHDDEPKIALPSLEKAIALHAQAWGNASILYYKMLAFRARMYIDLGRLVEASKIQSQLREMEPQFMRFNPDSGLQPAFDSRVQNTYLHEDFGNIAAAIAACEDVLAFAIKYNKDRLSNRLIADANSRLSQNYRKAKNLPQAASYNRDALRLLTVMPQEDSRILLSRIQYESDYGVILRDAKRYKEALRQFASARDSLQLYFPDLPAKFASNDAQVGYVLIEMDRLQEAWERFIKARTVFSELGEGSFSYTAKMDMGLAMICGKQQRYAEEMQYARRAIDSLGRNGILKGSECANAWKEAALGYLGMGKPDSASKCIEQARRAAMASAQYGRAAGAWNTAAEGYMAMQAESTTKSQTPNHPTSVPKQEKRKKNPQNELGDAGDPREAGASGSQRQPNHEPLAQEYNSAEITTSSNAPCATWWLSQAPNCKEIEYLDSAIHCLQRAIRATYLAPNQGDALQQDFAEISSQPEFLTSLSLMGSVHERLYIRTGCFEFLHLATAYYTRAAQMIAFMDASRLNLGASYFKWENLWEDNYDVLESAIRCGLQLHTLTGDIQHLRTAYVIADMGKARQLSKSQLFFGDEMSHLIPASIQQYEKSILQTIELYRKENQKGQWSQAIADLESQMVQLKAYLRSHFPRYYQLKYENQAHFERAAQTLDIPLAQGRAILQYFVGRDSIYAFLRTADTLIAAIIPDGQSIAAATSEFTACIQWEGAQHTRSTVAEFAPMAMNLCQKLLPFHAPQARVCHLLIIPDGFLHGLPFAALIHPGVGYDPDHTISEPPYLRNFVPIAQDFSTHSHDITQQRLQVARPIEAIDSIFLKATASYRDSQKSTRTLLPPLISNELQTFASTGLIQGSEHPTIAALFAALQKYGLIEIKTHGFATDDPDDPDAYILLEDPHGQAIEFHLSDLYGLTNFQTRMLILNACETAKGPYQQGEGPVSLARSFRQAGCPSLLTNLWQADDEANTKLLKAYYAALMQGTTTDQALQTAHAAALSGGITKHPFYWAGMTVYGVVEGVGF